MFASLYRAMRDVGMPNPRDVDQLDIWETAVLLGADETKTGEGDKYAHLRARVAFEQGLTTEKFEWAEPSAEEMELMSVLASGSSLT